MFKIEKDVPVPNSEGRGRPGKYPWGEMKPGESFLVPGGGKALSQIQMNVCNAASSFIKRKSKSWKFVTRVDHKAKGVRVWRVK